MRLTRPTKGRCCSVWLVRRVVSGRRVAVWLCISVAIVLSTVVTQAAKTQLIVWDWWDIANPSIKAFYDWAKGTFEASNPDIALEYQFIAESQYYTKIIASTAAGVGPDVVQLSITRARDFYNEGLLLDLSSFVAKTPSMSPSQFIPPTQIYNQKDGKIYGITFVMDASALLYNRQHFRETGLDDSPEGIASWDAFAQAAKKLSRREGGVTSRFAYTFYGNPIEEFCTWMRTNGGSFYNADFTRTGFNTNAGIETLRFLQGLSLDQLTGGSFNAETASMRYWGTWAGSYIRSANASLDFGMITFPKGPSGNQRGSTTWGNMMTVLKSTQEAEAAWRYISFICGLEADIQLLKLMDRPTSPRLEFYRTAAWREAVRANPWMEQLPAIVNSGGAYPFIRFADVNAGMGPLIRSVIQTTTMSPEEALLRSEELVNRLLAETE
jgi:ABC-type glycerol-3-phosphate transport system substrate-binding protein